MLAPFECLCGNFILPEPASYVSFYAIFNLRKLFYLIKEKRPVAKIDFKPYGAAIKAGRTKQKESRNKAADALFISPRYLANIENKGQHPSVQVFLELMSRYHISVDQILHGETMEGKSTERMQFETLLDELTDAEIKILTATAQALLDARTDNEGEN